MDEVDFTILAAKSVLTDMMDKCPPAETCRDAFDRTAKATIKMASSTGGFGVPTGQSRRARRDPPTWTTTPDSSKGSTQARHRHQGSDHAGYPFDLSLSDSLSSPTLSNAGEMTAQPSPPVQRGGDGYFHQRSRGGPSPSDVHTIKQDGSPGESSIVPTPPSVPRRLTSQPSTTPGASYGGQQFSGPGSVDYPDAQTMEFLQNLGNTQNGDFSNMEQSQVDLGFGMNWEGMHHDYSEGQQMNPFDSFFFGGPQGNNGNGANNGGGMGM